ncbi:hypothetical protein C8J57DRAFT_1292257 [Mycena rebaudengoi]|nr:hypothetical protein C8J57DRAFT_1292257 [Mycena rebaudengoi]
MAVIRARDSSSDTNLALILAIVAGSIVLLAVLLALFIPIFKRRRHARNAPPPSTLEQFMGKAERERVLKKSYKGHQRDPSAGPLLDGPSNWPQAGRHLRVYPSDLHPLPDNVAGSEDDDDDDAYELEPRIQTYPEPYMRDPMPSPPLRHFIPQSAPVRASDQSPAAAVAASSDSYELEPSIPTTPEPYMLDPVPSPSLRLFIPQSAPAQTSDLIHQSPAATVSASSDSSDSMYSVRSAPTRMHTVDLTSPPPPVPALPTYLQRPYISLPPEEPPLSRGDTVFVGNLLKTRAKRLERSNTQTSRIERADSITEAPSPTDSSPTEQKLPRRTRRTRPQPQPTATLSVDDVVPNQLESFAETLDYYESQLIESHPSDGTASDSSYDTETPEFPVSKPTKSAV